MTDWKRLFELKQDDWIEVCKEVDALKAENLSLKTHHTALHSALTRIAEGGVERGTNATVTRRMIAMAEIAQDTLESLKPPQNSATPNPPHPAEKGSGT